MIYASKSKRSWHINYKYLEKVCFLFSFYSSTLLKTEKTNKPKAKKFKEKRGVWLQLCIFKLPRAASCPVCGHRSTNRGDEPRSPPKPPAATTLLDSVPSVTLHHAGTSAFFWRTFLPCSFSESPSASPCGAALGPRKVNSTLPTSSPFSCSGLRWRVVPVPGLNVAARRGKVTRAATPGSTSPRRNTGTEED